MFGKTKDLGQCEHSTKQHDVFLATREERRCKRKATHQVAGQNLCLQHARLESSTALPSDEIGKKRIWVFRLFYGRGNIGSFLVKETKRRYNLLEKGNELSGYLPYLEKDDPGIRNSQVEAREGLRQLINKSVQLYKEEINDLELELQKWK